MTFWEWCIAILAGIGFLTIICAIFVLAVVLTGQAE